MGLFNRGKKDPAAAETGGMLARLNSKMAAATESLGRSLGDLFLGKRELTAAVFEELETVLLQADVGVDATTAIVAEVTERSERDHLESADAAYAVLREVLEKMLAPVQQPLAIPNGHKPFIVMVVGVNGAGKTTTIGKLAHRLHGSGLKTLFAAGDTFRAAAAEQVSEWAARSSAEIMQTTAGGDAAALAHDAVRAAHARGHDVLLIDTAGRLHTQMGLMDELKKIKRVVAKADPAAPHEVLLVLDAGNGQNALVQLEHFHRAVGVTGLCLTKLDGTAKGGVIFALAQRAGIPIRFIGVGEASEDLREFNAREFVNALLPRQ